MNMQTKSQENKPKNPNELGAIKISDSLKIIDRDSKQVIIEKKYDIPKR